jgi:hypothetical protein
LISALLPLWQKLRLRKEMRMKGKVCILGVVLILLLGFASGPAHAGSRAEIRVPDPTGIPETDWVSIQEALNSAEPGETVRLAAGTYKVHKPIVTESFEGTLEGAGLDRTIVEAVREPWGEGFGMINHPSAPGPIPALFWFDSPQQRIDIKNLTLQVLDPEPSDPYFLPWTGYTTNLNNLLIISGGGDCEARVENVALKGAPSTTNVLAWGDKNLSFALIIEDMGDVTVKNNHFEHAAGFAMEVSLPQSNSTVRIGHNTIYECSSAVYALSADGTENITLSIVDNHFQLYRHDWGQGVVIVDAAQFSGEPAFRATVVNNTISGTSSQVLFFLFLEDLAVAENRIVGSGSHALLLVGSSNSRVVENDAAGFVASVASIAVEPSWEGIPADNNLIVENTFGEADEAAIICAGNGNTFEENEYTGYYPGWPDAGLWWFQEGSADNQVIEPKVETEPEMDEDQIRARLWRDDNHGATGNVLILDDDDAEDD